MVLIRILIPGNFIHINMDSSSNGPISEARDFYKLPYHSHGVWAQVYKDTSKASSSCRERWPLRGVQVNPEVLKS